MPSARPRGSRGGTRYPVTPCSTNSGKPPMQVHTAGTAGPHRLEHREREALDGVRAEHDQIDDPQDLVDVAAHAREDHPIAEAEFVGEVFELRAKRAVADHQQARLRDLADHPGARAQKRRMILFLTQHGQDADDPVVSGDAELAGDLTAAPAAAIGMELGWVDAVSDHTDLLSVDAEIVHQVGHLAEGDAEVGGGQAVEAVVDDARRNGGARRRRSCASRPSRWARGRCGRRCARGSRR